MNKSRWYPIIFFLATALLVTAPLFFKSGYLLLLDWSPVPGRWSDFVATIAQAEYWKHIGAPFSAVVAFGTVLANGFFQKLFVTLSFFLAGYGAYRMAPVASVWPRVIVGLLFQFNPFIYSRMLTGQVSHVLAFALLPWWLIAMGRLIDEPRPRRALALAFMSSAIMWPSTHIGAMLVFAALLIGATAIMQWHRGWEVVWARRFLGAIVVTIIASLVLNAFWIIPLAKGRPGGEVAFAQSGITNQHILSFFTRTDPQHGVLWNVAAMYGFWGDDEWRYVPQKAIVPYWFWLLWVLLAVVAWGFVVAIADSRWPPPQADPPLAGIADSTATPSRSPSSGEGEKIKEDGDGFLRSRAAAVAMALVGVFAFVAAVGVAHPWFKPGALWVYDHVPFARGFREPQKFVALIVLVYAFFAARGIEDILARIDQLRHRRWWWFRLIAPGLFLLIPIAYSPGLLWGFRGQLQPRQYPQSWFATDRFLAEDHGDFRALFLPWHSYINLSFTGTIIANPAAQFFRSHPVIAGDNMEFGPIYSTSTRPESKVVEAVIRNPLARPWEAAMELAQINVKYVILPEESDYMSYGWVENAGGFREAFKGDRIRVFLNEAWEE